MQSKNFKIIYIRLILLLKIIENHHGNHTWSCVTVAKARASPGRVVQQSRDEFLRDIVRFVWPSGGTHHSSQGIEFKRRHRAPRGRTKGDLHSRTVMRMVTRLSEHACLSVLPPARMSSHVRTHVRIYARTYTLPWWSITLSTQRTRLGPQPISIWDKTGATLPGGRRNVNVRIRRNALCVAWLRDPDRWIDTATPMDPGQLICHGLADKMCARGKSKLLLPLSLCINVKGMRKR